MKIKPIKISITDTDEQLAENMYITASDSWGNEDLQIGPTYNAIAVLTDKEGLIKKKLTIIMDSEQYLRWDGSNQTILNMFLEKYDFLELDII